MTSSISFPRALANPLPYLEMANPHFSMTRIEATLDRKSTRLNSSHSQISYAVFCLKKNNGRLNGGRGCSGKLSRHDDWGENRRGVCERKRGQGGACLAPGTAQHVALYCATEAGLLA